VELISRRNMLSAATAAGCLSTAAGVTASAPALPQDKQPRDFDPASFTVVPPRRFEDLRVGDVFRAPSRTLTDAHAAAFQTVSADNHPIHYDVEYARRHGHVAPVVHGLQVFAFTAPGATLFPQNIGDVFVAFTSASCKFLKEVHAGDTLYPALEIVALTPQGDTGTNNAGDGVQPTR
jgi:acyl dehydratase